MMLHVLFATALSASPALPTDSVRNASKTATVRRDTTITAARDTTIAAVKPAPAPSPTAPAAETPSSSPAAAPAAAGNTTTTSGGWTTTLVKSSTVVVSTASAASAATAVTPAAAAPAAATPVDGSVKPAASSTSTPAPARAAEPRLDRAVVQQAGAAVPAPEAAKGAPTLVAAGPSVAPASAAPRVEPAPAPASRAAAPADASAVAPRPAETTKRLDARTVVSIRSSERIEPLYSVPLPGSRIRIGAPTIADSIVVYKRERTLTLFYRGVPLKSYFIALGLNPVGDKQRAGDGRTPEGVFHVNAHNPASKYHLALRLSYPDDAHRARAAAIGADPGGDIMIHGLPPEYSEAGKDHVTNDWTNGCVALSNAEIEELWRAVPDGTPVQIKP